MSKMIFGLCVLSFIFGCVSRPTHSDLQMEGGRLVRVKDMHGLEKGTAVHLHKQECHKSKNGNSMKSSIKCDKLRIADGKVTEESGREGTLIELDKEVKLSDGMFFEESGETFRSN